MSSDNPAHAPAPQVPPNDGTDDSVAPPAHGDDPYEAWLAALDACFRQTPDGSEDFQRALRIALDQARTLARIARGETLQQSDDDRARADSDRPAPDFGLWQPLMAAFEQCRAELLPEPVDARAAPRYAQAAAAYFAEFERLNAELAPLLARRLDQRDATVGFVELHKFALEEAERIYLERVSSDEFADRQAEFINEMLRLAKAVRTVGPAADGSPEK